MNTEKIGAAMAVTGVTGLVILCGYAMYRQAGWIGVGVLVFIEMFLVGFILLLFDS